MALDTIDLPGTHMPFVFFIVINDYSFTAISNITVLI